MNEPDLDHQLEQAQQTIRALQQELEQTSHGLVALSSELEQRVEERTAGVLEANRKLKETQMHLIQAEKMASLGQLVAGIAHEINNPLAFVLNNLHSVEGWLEQLARAEGERLGEPSRARLAKAGDRLRTARTGLDRMKELVRSLRTFSRLDEGEFKSVDIPESIDSVLMFLEHRMTDRLRVEKRYGPERTLNCYAGRLNQVFMNVLANAVEAIEGEGTITIRTAVEDGMFCISIRDTGAGIPKEIQSRIFDPFFTTKPVGQGTGLGLAISYGIVQAHQGSIEAVGEPGQGGEFRIRIPTNLKGAHP